MEVLLTVLGGLALVAGLIIYNAFAWGFVLYKFYYWFLIPVFPELPPIDFYEAVGLMICVGLFDRQNPTDYKTSDGVKIEKDENWVVSILTPWIVLLVVMFVRLFI